MRSFAILAAAAGAPLVAGLNYALPKQLMALESDCYYPASYEVRDFANWKPAAGNDNATTLDFTFVDAGAGITTPCHLNATSKSLTPANSTLAKRWACDDGRVSFIWQKEQLWMIEKVCPDQQTSPIFEASGSVDPSPQCVDTGCSFPLGDGQECKQAGPMPANFTSLQPSPL